LTTNNNTIVIGVTPKSAVLARKILWGYFFSASDVLFQEVATYVT